MSLSSHICGIRLDSCLMNASGCWCTTKIELDDLLSSSSGAIVSKSGTVLSRTGNPEPRLFIDNLGSINSMGLPNLGYQFYANYGLNVTSKPYIQSIYPFSVEEMETMLTHLNTTQTTSRQPQLIEVNISCPNLVGHHVSIDHYDMYMTKIKQLQLRNLIIGMKLIPLYEPYQFDLMSRLVMKNDIKFITCINSVINGLIVNSDLECTEILPKEGLGGIGGQYIKPTALANVYNFSRRLGNQVDIIGCGGVSSGKDVFDYILCGAKAVQIGTQLIKEGTACFDRISHELTVMMQSKNYSNLSDFYQKIRVHPSSC